MMGFSLIPWFGAVLLALVVPLTLTTSASNPSQLQATVDVLVVGGNGLIGIPSVDQLLGSGHRVTVLNRGTRYWDSEELVFSRVHRHIKCDRTELEECHDLGDVAYDTVIDFSAYAVEDVQLLFEKLPALPRQFIFISTDSVYEAVPIPSHGGPSKETDDARPTNKEERRKLSRRDSYGHQKLEIEEYLAEMHTKKGLSSLSLRLPDVIGERDNTERWLMYQLWLLASTSLHLPLQIPSSAKPISFVYSGDVARLISELVLAKRTVHGPYNVGYVEPIGLESFLKMMADALHVAPEFHSLKDAVTYFPSVTRGPIEVKKAAELGWKTTDLKEVVARTCEFFNKVILEDASHVEQAASELLEELRPDLTVEDFLASHVAPMAKRSHYEEL